VLVGVNKNRKEGNMATFNELIFLGTGSAFNFGLGNTSFLVKGSDGTNVLIDCGATVPAALQEEYLLEKVTDIAITHLHGDHIHGLEALGFMNYFVFRNRPRLHLPSALMAYRLWHECLRGTMEEIMDDEGRPVRATLETYFEVCLAEPNDATSGCARFLEKQFMFFPVPHIAGKECHGVIGPGFYYSGDSNRPPDELGLSACRYVFLDCQFFQSGAGDAHMPYMEFQNRFADVTRKKIHFVHIGLGWNNFDPQKDGFGGFVRPGQSFPL
jgi:phosphoribosyl 1,2-cyclic phosphodiesterase